jgi:hypothetical protein
MKRIKTVRTVGDPIANVIIKISVEAKGTLLTRGVDNLITALADDAMRSIAARSEVASSLSELQVR